MAKAALTESEAQTELARLAAEIARHDVAYHQKDAPVITDAEYDKLRKQFEALAKKHPTLAETFEVARSVGAAPAEKFAKVRHAIVPSISNAELLWPLFGLRGLRGLA